MSNITVVGSGYVGMSLSVLLARHNDVKVFDICIDRVNKINKKKSTIDDHDIKNFLLKEEMNLIATNNEQEAFIGSEFIIVATPTNYDPNTNQFDTKSVDSVVKSALQYNNNALIVIKSTIPIGYTENLRSKYNTERIIFSPEFLREGKALYDNLYPSRIVVGGSCNLSKKFANLLVDASHKKNVKTFFLPSTEAESIKLFSNTYLAMRVSFFNELDSFALANNLESKFIIDGLSLDSRIGGGYNNPSFGYGGYCLPKDTKQMVANFNDIPQTLMSAIVSSNSCRKDFLVTEILKENPKVIGIYRLIMKKDSDNYRSSAIQGIIKRLQDKNKEILIYEPTYNEEKFEGYTVIKNLDEFKEICDLIISNRHSNELDDISKKVFTRDIYNEN